MRSSPIAVPTANGWLFLLAALAASAVAVVNVGLATALAASLLSGFVLSSFLLAQCSMFHYSVKRERSFGGVCRELMALPVTVENRTPFCRMPAVLAEECPFASGKRILWTVPPLPPHGKVTLDRTVCAVRRGSFTLRDLCLRTGDPAGLFRKVRRYSIPDEVTIIPGSVPLSSLAPVFSRKVLPGTEGRPLEHAGSGYEFFGVRPYRHGDEMRFIHWRATARTGQLMVRELEANTVDRAAIVLDTFSKSVGTDPEENNFEALISAALSITLCLSRTACRLSFVTVVDDEPVSLNGDSAGIRGGITDLLTGLRPSGIAPENLLESVMEDVEPESLLYVLAMTQSEKLLSLCDLLFEQGMHVRLLLAPKINFPLVRPNENRYCRMSWTKIDPSHAVKPRVMAFDSRLADLLRE